jgi:hypothetical protein
MLFGYVQLVWKMSLYNQPPIDMFLISVPYADFSSPPCGPAVLKGIAESHGYTVQCHDLGIDFVNFMCDYPDLDAITVMSTWINAHDPNGEYNSIIDKFYDHCVNEILKVKCRYLGISVFSLYHHRFTLELCERLKQIDHDFEIVIGGKGISVRYGAAIENSITKLETMLEFHQILKKRKLIDYAIVGDAEDAIVDLLAGNFAKDNDTRQAPSERNLVYPFSNFDDYDIARYGSPGMGFKQLPVVSSKGCVRSCDFCDVGVHFAKFQSKDGARLTEEMIFLSQKYRIFSFALQDSIANGNMKSLTRMCETLAEYNQKAPPEEKITWAANWIARPPMSIKPAFFDLMAASGCESLVIGAESGSNYVLEAMRKKTSVEGLFYEIDQMDRCGIKVNINLIIGHWSERWVDFVDTLDMTLKLAYFEAKGTVTGFQIGGGFHALENTLAADYEYSGVVKNSANWEIMWWSNRNPDLTAKARFARIYMFWKMANDLNMGRYYDVFSSGNVELLPLVIGLEQARDDWKTFYQPLIPEDYQATCPSLQLVDRMPEFMAERLQNLFPSTVIKLGVDSYSCNGDPELFVRYNNQDIFVKSLTEGSYDFEIPLDYDYAQKPQLLEIGMRGKNLNTDTEVDSDGNILKDKRIILRALEIDNIDCFSRHALYYQRSVYTEEGLVIEQARPGFFKNSSIAWQFEAPFWRKVLTSKNTPLFYDTEYNVNNDLETKLRQEIDLMPY